MEPTFNNSQIIDNIYIKYSQSTGRTFLSIGLTFPLIWFAFDFLIGEPYKLHLFVNICISAFCLSMYFLSKKIPVTKMRFIHWSIFFNTTSIVVCYFTLTADHMFGYLLGLVSGALMYSVVFVSQLRYFIPNIIVCAVMPFFFKEAIEQNSLLDFYPFIFFLNFVHFFSCIGVYLKFKHSYIVENLNHTLQKRNESLEESNNMKRDLLRVMGHDIVNELHIHKLINKKMVRYFEKEKCDEKILKSLSTLDRSTHNILNIVDTVRTWESIKSGKVELTFKDICLNDIKDKSDYIFEDKLKAKGLKLVFEGEVSLVFSSDLNLITNHIYNNLISNAIKFSQPNSVINVKCVDKEESVEISVKDYGIGIPPFLLDKLFDTNKATSREGTAGEKGTGFGLPLVKEYTLFLGGNISVDSMSSEEASWSCFTLNFPKKSNR